MACLDIIHKEGYKYKIMQNYEMYYYQVTTQKKNVCVYIILQ